MGVMDTERERLKLSQGMDMEVMVDTEATEVMDMERERLKLMLSQVMDMVVMVDTVMEDLMEVMVVTEAMEAMVMERERLRPNQDMDMAAMEGMDMGVMVMESRPTSKSKYDCSKYQLNLYMRIFF